MKLALALTAGLVLLAPSSAQLCSNDQFCSILGGTCVTGNPGPNIECSKSVAGKLLCGTSGACRCCFRECAQTRVCSAWGGKCLKKEECADDTLTWHPELCICEPNADGTVDRDCGCCIPKVTSPPTPPKPCNPTPECAAIGGGCRKRPQCPTGFSWNPDLCTNTPNTPADDACGCCSQQTPPPTVPTPPPTIKPCDQTHECAAIGGSCRKRTQCPAGLSWDPELCSNKLNTPADELCGCCSQQTPPPTPPPSVKPCDQTDECKEEGGECRKRSQCPSTSIFKTELCKNDPAVDEERCGCCLTITEPPTPPPTVKPCEQTRRCAAIGGGCRKRAQCPRSWNWNPELCVNDPDAPGNELCGCCSQQTPPPTPCDQTEECAAIGGGCRKRAECPAGFDWKPELCKNEDGATGDELCGCCVKSTAECEAAPRCDAVKGKCLTDKADCPANFLLREDYCPGNNCICCFQG